ncbi:P-selectin glycoprotein ligand 1 [Archocentrus centrarchus]|uniref:P-selectin glycoprotein ligand 1 n=1 Tax=Archocentrus centrarchus TaxID=63155 RepID=UPI0011E9FC37|nr:cell wall protein DAN4-like [Archocentrus centrarchus]XP_030598945.1 cell wall protein DAN4-like [Archocentrus centrarchus]
MMLISVKRCAPLLWGVLILFAADSMAASTPETNNFTPTVEPRKTTTQLTTALGFQNKTDSHTSPWESTHKPAITTISEAAKSTVVTTVETKEAVFSSKTNSPDDSTVSLVLTTAAAEAPATSSSTPQLLHVSTAVGETQPSHHTTIKETATHTQDHSHQQSTVASTNTAAPATTSATFSSTVTVLSPQPTSIAESEMTSASSSSFSSEKSTADPGIQNLGSTSGSTTSTVTEEPISEMTHGSTSLPPTTAETLKTPTEISSTAQPITASSTPISTSLFSDTTESNATSISTESPNSTTAAGILIPRKPNLSPDPTTRSAPATESHNEDLKTTPSTEVQPCSTQTIVKHCLIIIAFLAVLTTIFIFSTIVLCVKLSVRKHRRKPQKETEMMCISALLPERSYNYTRQHNPVPNGVLVIPRVEDSDDEVGDNLTLSSFLPENDRYV